MNQERQSRAEDIFCEAMDMPTDRREAHFRKTCAGDLQLLEEVQQLYESYEEAERRSAFRPPVELIEELHVGDEPTGSDPQGRPLPSMVHHDELIRQLGKGGMGVVYEARNTKLSRIEAIKFISHGQASVAEARARFRTEQKALGRLKHPNVVQAFDACDWEGFELLVMELVEGRTLDELVTDDGPLAAKSACELAKQMADGLSHAHEMGVIHRDLKPRNVMVTGEHGMQTVKILDFGVAALTSPNGMATSVTESGAAVGTRQYMAPEVVDGGRATKQSDLYSLGCILHFLLFGHAPSQVQGTDRRGETLPRNLQSVLGRLLTKEPARRFCTALEVRRALTEVLHELSAGRSVAQYCSGCEPFYPCVLLAIIALGLKWLPVAHRLPFSPNALGFVAGGLFLVGGAFALFKRRGWRRLVFAFGSGLLAVGAFASHTLPPGGVPSRPCEQQDSLVSPEFQTLSPMSFPELLDCLLASLDGLAHDECRYRRFLELGTLGRRAVYDPAARKSLLVCRSLLKLIPGARPIDHQGLVYVVELRLGNENDVPTDWSLDLWIRSCEGYPYAFDFGDSKYTALKALIASKEPERDHPVLRGDWLLACWSNKPDLRPQAVMSLEHDPDLLSIKDSYDDKLSRRDAAAEVWLASDAAILPRLIEINNAYLFYEADRLIKDGRLDRASWDGSRWPGRESLWQKVAGSLGMGRSLPFAIPSDGDLGAAKN